MFAVLSICAIVLSVVLAGILFWMAYRLRAQLNDQRERSDAAANSVEKFDLEIAAVSEMARNLQRELHNCFGYITGDGVRAFYRLNEALTSAHIAKERMTALADKKDIEAILKIEEAFTGGQIRIQLPRDGRTIESVEQDFTVSQWREQSNEILETAEAIVGEAMAARARFLEDQKNEFRNEAERMRFKYPRNRKADRPSFPQRSFIRSTLPAQQVAGTVRVKKVKIATPDEAKKSTKKKSEKIVYKRKKLAA